MDCVEKFGYGLAFDAIVYSIENKGIDFNKNPIFMIYADKIKELFNDVVKGLESVIKGEIVKDLKKILGVSQFEYQNASKKDVQNTIKQFKDKAEYLNRLKENPKKFYEGEEAESLLDYCKKIKNSPVFNY